MCTQTEEYQQQVRLQLQRLTEVELIRLKLGAVPFTFIECCHCHQPLAFGHTEGCSAALPWHNPETCEDCRQRVQDWKNLRVYWQVAEEILGERGYSPDQNDDPYLHPVTA